MSRLALWQCAVCGPFLRAKEETSMARKVGQIIARGDGISRTQSVLEVAA